MATGVWRYKFLPGELISFSCHSLKPQVYNIFFNVILVYTLCYIAAGGSPCLQHWLIDTSEAMTVLEINQACK